MEVVSATAWELLGWSSCSQMEELNGRSVDVVLRKTEGHVSNIDSKDLGHVDEHVQREAVLELALWFCQQVHLEYRSNIGNDLIEFSYCTYIHCSKHLREQGCYCIPCKHKGAK